MKAVIAIAAVLAFAPPAHAEPLLFHNGRLFVDARVNGVPTEALLDSGAEATLIDPALAAKAKLPEGTPQQIRGSGGTANARIVEGATVEALDVTLHPEAVVVMDLGELSQRLIKRPTAMVLGRELFDAARLRIDIGHGTIESLEDGSKPSGVALPLTAHAGIESIPVSIGGMAAQAEFDLGNGSGPLISRALVKRLRLKPVAREAGGGIGGPRMRDVVVIPKLTVAGVPFREVRAAVDDQPNANDLNVGTSILKHFLITADFKSRHVWLQPVRRK
jgi:hypothetical protein